MPLYQCRVADAQGQVTELVREAASEEVLMRELAAGRLYPIHIAPAAPTLGDAPPSGRSLPTRMLLDLSQTMTLLLASGLTVQAALEIAETAFTDTTGDRGRSLGPQATSNGTGAESGPGSDPAPPAIPQGPPKRGRRHRLAALTRDLRTRLERGSTLREALAAHGAAFPPIYLGLIAVGERVGSLGGAFARLTEYLSQRQRIREKLISALIYPAIVIAAGIVGVLVIGLVVMPRLAAMFAQLGGALPQRMAAAMSGITTLSLATAALAVLAVLAPSVLALVARRSPAFAERYDALKLALPLIGRARRDTEILNFLFAMETLTEGGLAAQDAMAQAAQTIRNQALRRAVMRTREAIVNGRSLPAAFAAEPLFPERLVRWTAIGERTGRIDQVYAQLRAYYQGQLETWSGRFMSLVEPAVIILIGCVIFLIVFFFVLPIFTVYEAL